MNTDDWKKINELFHQTVGLQKNERAEVLASENDFVREEINALIASHESLDDFIAESAVAEFGLEAKSLVGSRIGRYKLLEIIGAGGMGTVYLAEKDGFEKQFAIKLIKRGMDTDAILRRFHLERQILSRLEHPNIARILDGGTTDDGLPFFVMEYVKGVPINRYCDNNGLRSKERLKLLRQVCSAVQHAHQNLIIHRDIKPSNIIVTDDGVPKLLDFGIAKLLDPQEYENTETQARVFTPEYASPEQLSGLPVTTATDVYSLGVVLYELLCGQRPFLSNLKSHQEIVNLILTAEPIRPSLVSNYSSAENGRNNKKTNSATSNTSPNFKNSNLNSKALRGDLDNIVLKALRKESERRYQSVPEFSEDIRRYLSGLPVSATADSGFYRFSKFIKRNRIGTAVACLILLLSGVAVWQAVVANRERAKAETRFKDVRQLANSIVFEFHDSIEKLPGSTPTRELLISRALEYLDKLASESEQDASLQMELADAYQKIGNIQGGFNTSHLGLREKSFESYSKALSIREKLVKSEPSNVGFRRKLAESYGKMSDALWIKTDVAGSLENQQKAFEINQKLGEELPNDKEIRYELAMAQSNFGRMLGANGRTEESLANVRQAAKIMEELAANEPNNRKIMRSLATCYERVAEILTGLTENHSEARALILKSQEINLRFLAEDPQDILLRRAVAIGYLDLGNVSAKLNDYQTALENSQKSLTIFEQLSAEDPKNEEFRQIVAAVETELCYALIKTGRASEAIVRLKKSLTTLQKLKAQSPTDEIVRFRIASVYEYLGKGYAALAAEKNSVSQNNLTNWHEARELLQKSYEIYKEFSDTGKTVGEEAVKVDEIAIEIAKCDAAISKIQRK